MTVKVKEMSTISVRMSITHLLYTLEVICIKGTSHGFCWSGNPLIIFGSKEIYIYFNTDNKMLVNLLTLWRKTVFGKLHSWGHSNSVFKFLDFNFIMCGAYERKEMIPEKWKQKYTHMKLPLKMVHHWSLKNQDLRNLFLETLFWINLCPAKKLIQTANIWLSCTDYVISATKLRWISFQYMMGV